MLSLSSLLKNLHWSTNGNTTKMNWVLKVTSQVSKKLHSTHKVLVVWSNAGLISQRGLEVLLCRVDDDSNALHIPLSLWWGGVGFGATTKQTTQHQWTQCTTRSVRNKHNDTKKSIRWREGISTRYDKKSINPTMVKQYHYAKREKFWFCLDYYLMMA